VARAGTATPATSVRFTPFLSRFTRLSIAPRVHWFDLFVNLSATSGIWTTNPQQMDPVEFDHYSALVLPGLSIVSIIISLLFLLYQATAASQNVIGAHFRRQ